MAEKRYIISDASKQVDVEAHVLRYWEEELCLDIPRNEMGHRYYTEENIKLLKNIKVLKEQGFQLKAIKMVLPELAASGGSNLDYMIGLKEELNNKVLEEEQKKLAASECERKPENEMTITKQSDIEPVEVEQVTVSDEKMQQFQMIIANIVTKVMNDNNPKLGQVISERVSDNVLKEMDYLMRMKEEREDERYKKLDETIRSYQRSRSEAAAAIREPMKKPKKKTKGGLFHRSK